MVGMYLPVVALMQSQHGLVTRRQLIGAGLHPRDTRRLLAQGALVQVRHGVYADAEAWNALDPYRGQPLLRVRGAHLTLTSTHAFSHDSAALLHGMGVPDARTALVHVTRRKVHGDAVRAGVKHHLAPYPPGQLARVDGLPALDVARTALDLAREHGLVPGVAACDHALRLGTTRAALQDVLALMGCWPESRVMRSCIDLADGGSETYGESEGRMLVTELGIGRPETQFGLTDGSRVVWCDMRVGRHIFEFDGALKYGLDNPSGADPATVLWREKVRQDFISGFHLGVSRITTHDCHAGRTDALRRLAREYAATGDRFGVSIDDLAPYVVRRRAA